MNFIIETLGCKVNQYESNVIKDMMIDAGYTYSDSKFNNDIVIINTCSVTNTADIKSKKVIKDAIKKNQGAIIVVCGCFSQVKSNEIKEDNNINIIIGNIYKNKIPDLIKEYLNDKKQLIKIDDIMNTKFEEMKLNNFDKMRAFIKIQDGCDNYCSYCIIPYTRGNVRSKNPRDVIDEVKALVNNNHKEVVLTGIHTGHYGSDLNNFTFYDLLNDILKVEGLKRLRISSIELNEITDEILQLFKDNNVLADHLHLPIQAGTDKILKAMNRKYNIAQFSNRIKEIRKIRPNISITTDLIVGFPDEDDNDFIETLNLLKELEFSKIHAFPYSEREGTKSIDLPNKVNEVVKKERCLKVIELSKELECLYMEKNINMRYNVIVESIKDTYVIGHTTNYLLVKIDDINIKRGDNIDVIIIDIKYPYCIGKKV